MMNDRISHLRAAARPAVRSYTIMAGPVLATGCATGGAGTSTSSSGTVPGTTTGTATDRAWRVTTKEHVDLWLHGFALLTSDTGRVPFFARGYKQQITALKRQRNVYSQLDANQQQLSQRFATNPALTNAQFLAMYFPSLQEIVNATDYVVRSGGNPLPRSFYRRAKTGELPASPIRPVSNRRHANRITLPYTAKGPGFHCLINTNTIRTLHPMITATATTARPAVRKCL